MKKPLRIIVVKFCAVLITSLICLLPGATTVNAQLLPVECRTRLMEDTFLQGTSSGSPNCGLPPETMTITMAVVDEQCFTWCCGTADRCGLHRRT